MFRYDTSSSLPEEPLFARDGAGYPLKPLPGHCSWTALSRRNGRPGQRDDTEMGYNPGRGIGGSRRGQDLQGKCGLGKAAPACQATLREREGNLK